MMPNMDGQEALTCIRNLESENGISLGDGAKVVMSTALSDAHNVLKHSMVNAKPTSSNLSPERKFSINSLSWN